MKTIYLDCGMGAAGDMLAAALLELLPDREAFIHRMNALEIPGVKISAEKTVKCGITGTHFRVEIHGEEEGHEHHHHHEHGHEHSHDHPHTHSSMDHIQRIVYALPIPTMVKLEIMSVYERIADAESRVHGVPVTDIHFHEVGAMDAVADITAVCWLMHLLKADRVVASPVHVGSGTVRCAHGVLPVPAPATALLLQGIPTYGGEILGELCTPTGAALLGHFVTEYGPQPAMAVSAVGYGMGRKDFPRANCLRAMLGEELTKETPGEVVELRCNIDDMTGEDIGFAMEQLMAGGALDVFTVPVGMKKSRPGVMLCVLCTGEKREDMIRLLLHHTTTLGVRETLCRRTVLSRREETVSTPLGPVRRKCSRGSGTEHCKWEYEDISAIAREKGMSLEQVRKLLG